MLPTKELLQQIIKAEDARALERPEFHDAPTFSEYLSLLMSRSGVTQAELRRKLLLERTYAYQLINGVRTPTRRQILSMAFVMRLDVDETQRLLNISGRGPLYPRKHFDAIALYALTNRMSLDDANDLLAESGENPLI